jgi:hypothetical protein
MSHKKTVDVSGTLISTRLHGVTPQTNTAGSRLGKRHISQDGMIEMTQEDVVVKYFTTLYGTWWQNLGR